jgi:endoplasmic reticulum Man9GlcNAc2 1,2-alpha-mannosidase
MVVRDPFNIHKKESAISILRTTATRAAIGITEKAVEAGINAIEQGKKTAEEMSFQMPKNVPSFSNPQRAFEDRAWGSGTTSSYSTRFGSKSQSLPMYKDKPYAYPPSERSRAIWRRKRVIGFVFLILSLLFWFGAFSSDHGTEPKRPSWSWLKAPENEKKMDWSRRRERVVEAFELSWDAYHRYAWGKTTRPV